MLNQENLLFLQKGKLSSHSLCHQNVNNYSVPLNKTKLFDFKQELSSRQDSLVKSKLQGIKKQLTKNNYQNRQKHRVTVNKPLLVNIVKF